MHFQRKISPSSFLFVASALFINPIVCNIGKAMIDGTACCAGVDVSCYTTSGTTPDGKHYAYCFQKGDHVFTKEESEVAKCLTGLHAHQSSACIGTKTTKCDTGPDIHKAHASALYGNHQLEPDDEKVIEFGLDQAVKDGLKLKFDETAWLEVVRTADNGNGSGKTSLTFMNHEAGDC
ncbi:MAG: hypothetical protein M1812_004917 [Candelaria pacifica]|nr:MAG: hypothetical protein M1812_004917 [Candelaria pacifica]